MRMDLKRLCDPFPAEDVEWRVGRAGKNQNGVWAMCLAYITNRAIMERLDAVVGPENWRNEYAPAPNGGVLCGLSIRVEGEWVTKWDGADNTDMEAVKGGLSGAMKRAGVQWGIGRYLYKLPEGWATVSDGGAHHGKTKDGVSFRWDPPALPAWALPSGHTPTATRTPAPPQPAPAQPTGDDMIPCPKCGGEMWDNRKDKKNPRAPDLKCKDKDGCDNAVWLESWGRDLLKELEAAHAVGAIDAEQRSKAEDQVNTLSPKALLKIQHRLEELAQETPA